MNLEQFSEDMRGFAQGLNKLGDMDRDYLKKTMDDLVKSREAEKAQNTAALNLLKVEPKQKTSLEAFNEAVEKGFLKGHRAKLCYALVLKGAAMTKKEMYLTIKKDNNWKYNSFCPRFTELLTQKAIRQVGNVRNSVTGKVDKLWVHSFDTIVALERARSKLEIIADYYNQTTLIQNFLSNRQIHEPEWVRYVEVNKGLQEESFKLLKRKKKCLGTNGVLKERSKKNQNPMQPPVQANE